MSELPKGWKLAHLDDLCEWGSGGTPRRSEPSYFGGEFPWITISDLNDGRVSRTAENLTEAGIANSAAKLVPEGTVLVALYGSIGKLGITTQPSTTNQAIACALPDEQAFDHLYLFHYLRSKRHELGLQGTGVTQKNIYLGDIKAFDIPVAPRAEQTRIVEKLEELLSDLDAGVTELKAAQKKLTQYRQSLLKAAVEGALTAEWREARRNSPSPQPLSHQGRGAMATDVLNDTGMLTPLPPRGGGAGGEGAKARQVTSAIQQQHARELRSHQTPTERDLWQQLRAKRFAGFKFRRQQPLGRYIVDFVCFEQRLIVELDGSQHADQQDYDAERDAWLQAQGFRVLRFWNNQWSAQPEAVLEAIWLGLQQEPSLPNPSPARGEGLETGAQLLERILIERRARWEAKQLAKFAEQGKTPPKDWQKKYPEPVQPDITGLPELPEGWVWATLSQVGWLDRGRSKHRPRNAPHLYGGPYPFVQTGDIRHADTFLSNVEATYSEAGLAQSRLWPVGTMCITIAANIGKTAILSMEACFPDSVVGFLSGSDDVSIRYVEYFMRSVQQKLEDEAPATAQKNINLEILEKVAIPVPPTLEQHQIVKLLEDSMGAARESDQAIELSLKQSAAQRQNILRAAFAGQLVPQDPDDEPASVLLERIRAERAEIAKQPKKRQPKKQKEVTTMVSKLIDVLAEAGDWLEAQEAFRRCGVADGALTERIEELYAELRKLDKAGRLAVEAVTDAQGRKLHDRLKLLAG